MATPTYTAIQTTTLQSAASSVTFSSIPSGYQDIICVVEGETAASGRSVMRLNGNTSSVYSAMMMSDGNYAASSSGSYLDPMPGYSITGRFSAIWQIMGAGSTTLNKTVLIRLNQHDGAHLHLSVGRYANNSRITSVTFLTNTSVNYSAGTVFSLYGIEA